MLPRSSPLYHLLVHVMCFSPPAAVSFAPDLGAPKGIRFSDVTDTSSTVHWAVPRARVDSYRVTYVPAHGGQSPVVKNILVSQWSDTWLPIRVFIFQIFLNHNCSFVIHFHDVAARLY